MAPSAFAASGGGCELQGTANISRGLNANAQNFSYSFNGNLSGCQSTQSGSPTSGTVSAGEVVTIAVGKEPHGLAVWPQPGRYSLGHTGNMR